MKAARLPGQTANRNTTWPSKMLAALDETDQEKLMELMRRIVGNMVQDKNGRA